MEVKKPIKVGDYVRIKYMGKRTKIGRIEQILEKDPCYYDMQIYAVDVSVKHGNSHFSSHWIYEEDIIDYSSEIIKLVEIGDYVNGCRVLGNIANMYLEVSTSDFNNDRILPHNIKSILTKENFKAMNYVIGE